MHHFSTIGLILRCQPKKEVDARLSILTKEYGKIQSIVRGIRRPASRLLGHLDSGSISHLMGVYQPSSTLFPDDATPHEGRWRVISALTIDPLTQARQNAPKDLLWLMRLLHLLPILQTTPELWQITVYHLDILKTLKKGRGFRAWSALHILQTLGYGLHFGSCNQCSRAFLSRSDIAWNGDTEFLCSHCARVVQAAGLSKVSAKDVSLIKKMTTSSYPPLFYPPFLSTVVGNLVRKIATGQM